MAEGIGYAAAVVLAAVFLWAAAAKLAHRDDTVRALRALKLPVAGAMAGGVPAAELVLAVVLLAAPRPGAAGALVVLAAFSVVLLRALRAGVTAPCACFGSAATEPVSSVELVRNGLLGVLAGCALYAPRPVVPAPGEVLSLTVGVAAGWALLSLYRRKVRAR